jgi:putative cofactor-binding repeat protein
VVADNVMDQATGHGPGIYVIHSWPRLWHTTIARNSGGDGSGVYVTDFEGGGSPIVMTNTVIVSHTVGIAVTEGSTATLNGTLWHANTASWSGNVNHANDRSGDPAFAADGYHLTSASMAIDRGVTPAAEVTTDVDGDTRPQGGGYDLGADEFPAAAPDMVWNKQIRINGGPFQDWDSGPFTAAPGDAVTVVDRVWVTATGDVSFTLRDAWSPLLGWEGYNVTAGAVISSDLAATWSVVGGVSNAWHVLTKTLRAVASSDYVDMLTETLTVQGTAYQPPERIVEFQQPRPQPVWDKSVHINGGVPQAWNAGPFIVAPGDTVAIVDRVWITHTGNVTFALKQNWEPGVNLDSGNADAGAVISSTGALTWNVTDESANQWRTLTITLQVTGTDWLHEAITEALTVEGMLSQPAQRVVGLFNRDTSTGCYVRINAGSVTYPTVQAAVDVAQPGDLVKVAGYCTGVNDYGGLAQVVYLDESLTVRGGYTTTNWTTSDPAANPTILDAQGQGWVLYITGDPSAGSGQATAPTVEGLHITGGDADGLGDHWEYDAGGGVYIGKGSPVISGNLVYSNTAEIGGGMYLYYSNATLNANVISSNTLSYGGEGGGLYLYYGLAAVSGNTIRGNKAPAGWGGGISVSSSPASLNNNIVTGNTSNRGGGMYLSWSNATLNGNLIAGNVATWSGGGLDLDRSDALLVNNVVADNQAATKGSGIYVEGFSPRLLHTTIARNSGGDGSGVHVTNLGSWYSIVAMTNTIIAGHSVGITVTAGNTATLDGTLWHANILTQSGSVNHTNDRGGDPAFAPDGCHLTSISAAIGQGVDVGVTTDIDGDARPIGLLPDLGADEYLPRIYLPLVLR